MRHLMSPLDFTVEELDQLFCLADDMQANPENMRTCVQGKSLLPASMSPAPGHV